MKIEDFEKLKDTERGIKEVEECLEGLIGKKLRVGYWYYSRIYGSSDICWDMPKDLAEIILEDMEKWLKENKKKFEEKLPNHNNNQPKTPWYKFW